MLRTALASNLVVALFALGVSSAQSEFSAEIVDLKATGVPTVAKIYFTKDKKRIEMQDSSGDDSIVLRLGKHTSSERGVHIQVGGRGDVIIMNFATGRSTVLFPQENKYYDGPINSLTAAERYSLYAFVQPTDVDDACREWMQRPGAQGETCRNLGRETINGRSTIKYELSCYGEVCRLWIDRALHVLLRRETVWNSTELRNITESPQKPNLFEIPAGYSSKNIGGTIQPTFPQ